MNERVPDSTGLPLRAMVMVLLFLGVVFLLLGWQAVGSSGNSDDDMPTTSVATASSAPATPTSKPPAKHAEVRVYNVSIKEGLAKQVSDDLKAADFTVSEVGDLQIPDVSTTTVYYSDADGEKATAEAVAHKLKASAEPRIPALANQPPGVIVLVTG